MTTVGIVGLGKLGLPVAVTLGLHGFRVLGFDTDPSRMQIDALRDDELDADGRGPLSRTAHDADVRFCSLEQVVSDADCVLVAVQTPHSPLHDGTMPLTGARSNFSYDYLVAAVTAVVGAARCPIEIGVISTVLPGTVSRLLLPITDGHNLVYCPQFLAMGRAAQDFRRPEFVLLGCGTTPAAVVRSVLVEMGGDDVPVFEVTYETAELAKVTYNTMISAKVALSNLVQQMAHEVGASAADVLAVLRSANRRIASAAYIGPGMGDGGPCHPRDNIAMSWLAGEIGMTTDLFTSVMMQRESYVGWLADLLVTKAAGRPLVVLGTAYKPSTSLEAGSSTVLLIEMLKAAGHAVLVVPTPDRIGTVALPAVPAAYLLGCPEPTFAGWRFPVGSVVIDPWHVVPPTADVELVQVGEGGAGR